MTPDPKAWFSRLVLSVPLSHRYDTSGKIVRETKVASVKRHYQALRGKLTTHHSLVVVRALDGIDLAERRRQ